MPPAARSLGTRRGGRGSGGGGEAGGPSGSHCLGQCQPARGGVPLPPAPALQSPGSVASLRCPICHRHLPRPHLPAQREPKKEAGAGTLPRTTPGKTKELERNLPQVAAGAAPLCARRLPALQLRRGAAEPRVPPRCALPPPLPPGPEPPLSLKWLQSQVEASPDPADGGGQSGCSGAHNPAPPPARTNTPQPHTLNFDDCAMQSGCIVPSALPAAGL